MVVVQREGAGRGVEAPLAGAVVSALLTLISEVGAGDLLPADPEVIVRHLVGPCRQGQQCLRQKQKQRKAQGVQRGFRGLCLMLHGVLLFSRDMRREGIIYFNT